MDWEKIREEKISEEFIETFIDKFDLDEICWEHNLSETFIRKHADKVNWQAISRVQTLSESFLEEFQEQVDWEAICATQVLSEPFMIKMERYMFWDIVLENQDISESFKKQIQEKIPKPFSNFTVNGFHPSVDDVVYRYTKEALMARVIGNAKNELEKVVKQDFGKRTQNTVRRKILQSKK